ncbi:MAG TPA: HAMP domain-containing protein [Polyangiaceae bacterium]|nr:HAMP domain-containing protein [Polyangiaceae bacterium]
MNAWLHAHPQHRRRQLRGLIPLALLLAATLVALALQYALGSHQVQAEFFRAHKTISNTGQLLRRGTLIGGVALVLAAFALTLWSLRLSHRFVRPVHTLHRALLALAEGDLGVRLEFHRRDEFGEVAESLNRLVGDFAATLRRSHELSARAAALAAGEPQDARTREELNASLRALERSLGFFRLAPERVIRDERA